MYFCMYTITGCKHQQPLNLNACCMSRTVVHGYVYISAVAIYSLEDMINIFIYENACSSLLVCEYWYQVLLSIVSSIVLPSTLVVPICCTDIFVCKRMYTIDLNFNHAHHRDTYRYICSTHIFACKRTYQNAYD